MGTSIQSLLLEQGFEVKTLKRWDINNPLTKKDLGNSKKYFWSNPEVLEGAEAVIHLAGANVGNPWTSQHKQEIISSRIEGTRDLVDLIKNCQNPPKRLVCASAIGYYQDPCNDVLTETGAMGTGFLTQVCSAWENEAQKIGEVCELYTIRIGLVLSNRSKLLQAAYYQYLFSGMVGSTGSPSHVWSWIHIVDLAKIFVQSSTGLIPSGIYNGVAPQPTTQKNVGLAVENHPLNIAHGNTLLRLLQTLGDVLNGFWRSTRWLSGGKRLQVRPIVPGWVMRIAWGERSVLALTNQRVSSQKLLSVGFNFQFPDIDSAIQHLSQNPKV